jgi:hypothetical protein
MLVVELKQLKGVCIAKHQAAHMDTGHKAQCREHDQ